ncbi:MAG: hypothetical protein DWQ42_07155 [Planctomycetota bacterium]|nr:MAG: hypothetical protein DWQ42_07155 [Planctomycetota bacterium]REK48125.1 MAG: hypothetical protein DWQ46_02865 [Planctomycetota bacterium]
MLKATCGLSIGQGLLGIAGLTLLAVVSYGHTLDVPFTFDDLGNIQQNRFVRLETFDPEQLYNVAFRSQSSTRPVAYISFALNYYLFGEDVRGFHLVNITIHVMNGALVSLLALVAYRQWLRRDNARETDAEDPAIFWLALLAGGLFVVHPLQIQAVTYLVQRMTSLAVTFYLGALLAYVAGRRTPSTGRQLAWWLGGLVLWGLALGTKQIAVTLPLAVALYEWFFLREPTGRGVARRWPILTTAVLLGFAVLICLVAGIIYMSFQGFRFPGYEVRDYTPWQRVLTQFRVVLFYLGLVFWPLPSRLNLLHDFSTSRSLLDPPTTLLAFLSLTTLFVAALGLARRVPLVSFAILWFFLQLALESSVVPLEMAFEHRLYLPLVGICLAVPWLLRAVLRQPVWQLVVGVVLLGLLARATYVRNEVWRDPVRLWTDVIDKNEDDARAYNNRGSAYESRGEFAKALADHERSIELEPTNPMRHYSRAVCLFNWGKLEEALADFSKSLQLFERAGKPDGRWTFAYESRARTYYRLGRLQEAFADLDAAIALAGNPVTTLQFRGELHQASGNSEAAIRDFSEVIVLTGGSGELFELRGSAREAVADFAGALVDYERAIQAEPRMAGAYLALAKLLLSCPEDCRDPQRALDVAREACERTNWKDGEALAVLAAAHAALGDFAQAIQRQVEAMEHTSVDQLEVRRATLSAYSRGEVPSAEADDDR